LLAREEVGELWWLATDDLTDEDDGRCDRAGRGQERSEVGVGGDDV
jgi:hypothetical protein